MTPLEMTTSAEPLSSGSCSNVAVAEQRVSRGFVAAAGGVGETWGVELPEVEYARSGDLSIAYQVVGDGPVDLVYVPLLLSPVFSWYVPQISEFFRQLASFSRLILFDKRGTGASDRPRTPPTLELQMDDVRAVLDAVGSEQAALLGAGHGGQMAALFAATYPERTVALVLYSTFARLPGTAEEHRQIVRGTREHWGRRESMEESWRAQAPSLFDDLAYRQGMMLASLATASPGAAAEFRRTLTEADVTDILPAIRVPTLILYRRLVPEPINPPAARGLEQEARQLAAAIPAAQMVLIGGHEYAPFAGRELGSEVERFLRAPRAAPVPDRVLATVLFTDIVASSEQAVALGDKAWRELLNRHRSAVRSELRRFRGEEMDTAGDGFFAAFDGPARAIACAQAIIGASAELGLQVRAGLHTGECERDDGKLIGIAVHIGARVAAEADSGQILVSSTVKDLVAGSGIEFEDQGEHQLKGISEAWRLFRVAG
jgi:class 3 adenylate cyclase